MKFDRITIEPDKMGGAPCIRGHRIPLATIFAMLVDGMPKEEILNDFPQLEAEDIDQAIMYAASELLKKQIREEQSEEEGEVLPLIA